MGAGFLYARPEVQSLLKPLVVSWGYESEASSGSTFIDHNEWWGTRDLAAFLAVPEAIRFQQENDWDEVRATCHQLLCSAQAQICAITGLPPLHSYDQTWFAQMATAPLPANAEIGALKQWLYDEYRIEIPLIEWNGNKLVRISVQGYNSARDVARLCRALSALLPASMPK